MTEREELPEPALSIAAVERDTGLSKDTLRVWERRYGFPQPLRDPNGERLYPPEQVDKLRLIRRLLDRGRRPSQIVTESADALAAMAEACCAKSCSADLDGKQALLLERIRLHSGGELVGLLQQLLLKQGLQRFAAQTVAPLAEAVGEAWMRGEIDVAEEHFFTEQVQNVLRGAIRASAGSGAQPRVMLTTFPDELHGLGLLMVEATLVPEGAHCVSLGAQTPLASIRAAAVDGAFDVVGLSFSLSYPLRRALDGLEELRAQLPDGIEIWAGGGGMRERQRRIPGVRVIGSLDEVLLALQEWRSARAA
jgi:DNA-binding transcriptional MerR regulator/methylmalonyl-CoA mutase cobalamin-binding subunit